ncbi:TPA: FixH family protein [Neisseria weaveri]|uniref:Inner membrane protein n=2 Tax=Neisseria weaveri TaxID=28091 RepID=A0A3S4ZEJ3_9NEIS|nr:FixH family protein [Neisseria weaveri]EGV35993.1 putative inner membrane protein [Neisseria weaveri LMG 5135]EGV37350.1 putative inner membrane protein [Neisseria weaveri ATCC 51223]SAY50594.1 Inner membrane protein [Neisseria weaveri]VEJ52005.1 Inner membrane protein [Neisseria weaveri]
MAEQQSKVWYKEPWPWLLMAGPIIVVFAGFYTYYLAQKNAADLVSDDYYKDGKHIDILLHRDEEALKRNIHAQILISPNNSAAKVFVSGDFDKKEPLNLVLLHPSKKSEDQTVVLKAEQNYVASGDKIEYSAVFKPLPHANHWYVRVEDTGGKWRVEDKWIVSQGNAVNLKPMEKLLKQPESSK